MQASITTVERHDPAAPGVAPAVTLILPARNEANNIRRSLHEVEKVLEALHLSYEIILADSASTDDTAGEAHRVATPNVRVVRLERAGKGYALSRCMAEAKGGIIGFIDSDLEIAPEYLATAISTVTAGADAAVASKLLHPGRGGNRPRFRRATTLVANALIRRLLGTSLSDHQAGLKVFRREALLPALARVRATRWLWDTELLVHLVRSGSVIREFPVATIPTRASSFGSLRQLLSASLELAGVLLRLRVLAGRERRRARYERGGDRASPPAGAR